MSKQLEYLSLERQLIDAHNELDRVSIPREGHDLPTRVKDLVGLYLRSPLEQAPDGAPFRRDDTVALRQDRNVGPEGMLGEVVGVRMSAIQMGLGGGSVWVADVNWSNDSVSNGIPCSALKLYARPSDAGLGGRGKESEGRPFVSAEQAHGDDAAPWMGSEPAEGSRRAVIRDAIVGLTERVGNQTTPLMVADAVESSLLGATIDAEARYRGAEAMTDGIEKVEPEGFHGEFEVLVGPQGNAYVKLDDLERTFANLRIDVEEKANELRPDREQASNERTWPCCGEPRGEEPQDEVGDEHEGGLGEDDDDRHVFEIELERACLHARRALQGWLGI